MSKESPHIENTAEDRETHQKRVEEKVRKNKQLFAKLARQILKKE